MCNLSEHAETKLSEGKEIDSNKILLLEMWKQKQK